MKILKYTILALFLLNLPGISISAGNSTLGSLLSYLSFIMLGVYYFINLKGKPNFWLIYIGLAYFIISGIQIYQGSNREFLIICIKYFILVFFGNELFKQCSKKELLFFLLIGATTIIINSFFFQNNYGRYGGFYINPNAAGFICLIGYGLTYSIEKRNHKVLAQIIFTLGGFMTFSRTFIVVWIIINLFSLLINIKNIRIFGIGIAMALALITFGELFNIGGLRFKMFQSAVQSGSAAGDLSEGSRTDTWAVFYKEIVKHPFFGDGYGKFQGGGIHLFGPHNTFILIIGEAGIIPLLLFISLLLYFLYWSARLFSLDPALFFMTLTLCLYLTTSHTYFNTYIKLCITLFIYTQISINRDNLRYKISNKPEYNKIS